MALSLRVVAIARLVSVRANNVDMELYWYESYWK